MENDVVCNSCGAIFSIVWSLPRTPPEYCPFCGDEWDVHFLNEDSAD